MQGKEPQVAVGVRNGHAIGLGHEQEAVAGGHLVGGAIEAVAALYARVP